jgi:hypothetical protein
VTGSFVRQAVRLTAVLLVLPPTLAAQAIPADLAQERARLSVWLSSDPLSPHNAVARREIGAGLVLGPASADIPLAGVAEHRVRERDGRVIMQGPDGERVLPRGRPAKLARFAIVPDGAPGRSVLTVFRPGRGPKATFYPYQPGLVFEGTLAPPEREIRLRVLGPDGVEADAVEAGTVRLPFGGAKASLRVLRIRAPGSEESELMVYVRDGTSGAGSYPAGRFVELIPTTTGRFRLDFNRARNPYCAYNTVYPCPAPWKGNTIPVPVRAGEMYAGAGLAEPAPVGGTP